MALLLPACTAAASTYTVTSLADDNGAGTLRHLLGIATGGDIINFGVSGVINLTQGELLLTANVTISGPGAPQLAISGEGNGRIFEIKSAAGPVIISDLTIVNGRAPADPSSGIALVVGGIGIYRGLHYPESKMRRRGTESPLNHLMVAMIQAHDLMTRTAWHLEGYDTFAMESYPLPGDYPTKTLAIEAAKQRLRELEKQQPTDQSGGQLGFGIQDRVFVVAPDGRRCRILPEND